MLPLLALIGTAAPWGTSFVAAKAALVDIPPVVLACLRFAIAAVVLVPFVCHSGIRPVFGGRSALLGLTGIALFFLCQNAGLQAAGAAEATLILGGGLPVLTAFLGVVVLDRGVAAVSLVTSQGRAGFSLNGTGLLLLAAGCGAAYTILGRRAFGEPDFLAVLAGSTVYGVLFLPPPAGAELAMVGMEPPSVRGIGLLLYLGLGCSALAFALWAFGLRHLSAAQNAIICNLELPIGLVAAAMLMGEALAWEHVAGGSLVLAGTVLAGASAPRERSHVGSLMPRSDRKIGPS